MRVNLPVTQHEFDFPEESMLVSSTDTKGIIVHCNPAFIEASGYSHDELVGQPHNLIRHPDMPPQAFKDMWSTVGRVHTWTGLVKNRRKDGGFYWVRANVTPIMEGGKREDICRCAPSRAAPRCSRPKPCMRGCAVTWPRSARPFVCTTAKWFTPECAVRCSGCSNCRPRSRWR